MFSRPPAAEKVADILCSVDGPALNNVTKAEYNRFHDDKSTYTGEQGVGRGWAGKEGVVQDTRVHSSKPIYVGEHGWGGLD